MVVTHNLVSQCFEIADRCALAMLQRKKASCQSVEGDVRDQSRHMRKQKQAATSRTKYDKYAAEQRDTSALTRGKGNPKL